MDIKFTSNWKWVIVLSLFLSVQYTRSEEKPNIIYILADDLGYGDVGCYGQTKIPTPNIDKLAAEGIRFTQHYSGATVCAPSRTSLLTGQHTGHTLIRGNKEVYPEGQYPMPAEAVTFAEVLNDAGYVTGAFGKWGLGYPGSEGDPVYQGFDDFFGYNCQRYSHRYYPPYIWKNLSKYYLEGNDWTQTEVYAQDVIHDETIKFIEDNKDNNFMAYVSILLPHAELIVPDDSIYQKFMAMDWPDWSYSGNDYGDDNFKYSSYSSVEKRRVTFAAMVYRIDVYVGQIVAKIKELGIEDNTLIIFTSDNGPHTEGGADPTFFNSGGPLSGTKRDVYEGGIRVPFIANWPGKIAAGQTSDYVSAFWDMLPTFAELAGTTSPEGLDGISMLPAILSEEGQKEHDYLYWEFHEKNGRQAVRFGDWKGVRLNIKYDVDGHIELYNLATDIGETTDISADHPDIIAKMEFVMQNARSNNNFFNFGLSYASVSSLDLRTLSGSTTAAANDTLQLCYSVLPESATDRRCSFEVISDGATASINDFGEVIIGEGEGELKIVATSLDNSSVSDTFSITVGSSVILATKDVVVDSHSATVEGEVKNTTNLKLESVGFCYAEDTEPTITNDTVIAKMQNETITATINNLGEEKTYIVKAFATTSTDTIYSKSASFTMAADGSSGSYDLGDYVSDFLFYLPLDGNADDVTGNVTPVLNGNPTFTTDGAFDDAMYFDGNDDYIQIPEGIFDPTEAPFTFMAWVKPEFSANDMIILQQTDLIGTGRSILFTSADENNFNTFLGGTEAPTLTQLNPDIWNHVAITVNPLTSTVQLFVNGKPETAVTRSIEPTLGALNIGMHKYSNMGSWTFKGNMDNIMMFNGILTDDQIYMVMYGVMDKSAVITSSEKEMDHDISIFPNPTTGKTFNINFNSELGGQRTNLKVCDLNGKSIYTDQFTIHSTRQLISAGLEAGAYIVILETNGIRTTSRLIVR